MQADAMNATSLAYIGDALMSLYVREYLLSQGYQKPNDLQVKSTYYVSAKAQAHYVKILMEQSFFREQSWKSYAAAAMRIRLRKPKTPM